MCAREQQQRAQAAIMPMPRQGHRLLRFLLLSSFVSRRGNKNNNNNATDATATSSCWETAAASNFRSLVE
jgi:hypothetical protein